MCDTERERERESNDGDSFLCAQRETFESMFYSIPERTKYPGDNKGWPKTIGGWCHHLKYGSSKINIRKIILQSARQWPENRADLGLAVSEGSLVQRLKAEGDSSQLKRGFSSSAKQSGADKNTIVQYLGIAADEPERIKRHTKPGIMLPLVEIGWDEAYCRQWCEENDLLSPIYTTATRGGCWFCHNQGIEQLRLLRQNYPEYWALMLKWDKDSPVTFHPDGKTVHDFDRRFAAEDRGLVPSDRKFRWKMLDEEQTGV